MYKSLALRFQKKGWNMTTNAGGPSGPPQVDDVPVIRADGQAAIEAVRRGARSQRSAPSQGVAAQTPTGTSGSTGSAGAAPPGEPPHGDNPGGPQGGDDSYKFHPMQKFAIVALVVSGIALFVDTGPNKTKVQTAHLDKERVAEEVKLENARNIGRSIVYGVPIPVVPQPLGTQGGQQSTPYPPLPQEIDVGGQKDLVLGWGHVYKVSCNKGETVLIFYTKDLPGYGVPNGFPGDNDYMMWVEGRPEIQMWSNKWQSWEVKKPPISFGNFLQQLGTTTAEKDAGTLRKVHLQCRGEFKIHMTN